VSLCDVGQAVAPVAVAEDGNPVDLERAPADVPALQPGAAHPCPYPFDDEIALQFCDRPDDDDDSPPERVAGIDALAEADELDAEAVELVQHLEEVPDGSGDPVRGPHQDDLETAASGIPEPSSPGRRLSFPRFDPYTRLRSESPAAAPSRADRGTGSPGANPQWIRAGTEQRFSYFPLDRSQDVTQFNSRNLGALIVDEKPHVKSRDEPQYSIQNLGIEESYGVGVLNEGQAIAGVPGSAPDRRRLVRNPLPQSRPPDRRPSGCWRGFYAGLPD